MTDQHFQILLTSIQQLSDRVGFVHDELKEHKQDTARQFAEIKEELKVSDARSAQGFIEVKELVKEEKREREKMEDKLDKVYESRDRVTVQFSRAFAGVNVVLASLIALLTSLFTWMWTK